MIDYLFIQPPFWGTVAPNLGLGLLKAVATAQGYRAECLDLNIHLRTYATAPFDQYWDLSRGYDLCEDREAVLKFYNTYYFYMKQDIDKIKEKNPSQIWITVQNSSALFTRLFLRHMRAEGVTSKLLVGGPQVWEFFEAFMKKGSKFILEIYPEVDNFWTVEGELFLQGNDKPYVENLDDLPFPDFSEFVDNRFMYDYPGALPTYFTRGCPNRCIYCSERNFLGGKFRWRSGENVFDEINYQNFQHPYAYFFQFRDSVGNGNLKELEIFCRMMVDSGLSKKIRWSMGDVVVRKGMVELYPLMKKAGCYHLGYGLETASHRVLDKIGKKLSKGVDFDMIVRAAHEHGIKTSINFMFGLPGETEDDFQETLEFLRRNYRYMHDVNPSINMCGFFPGSEGWRNPEKHGIHLGDTPIDWVSTDKPFNNYEIRRKRFLRFVDEANKLGMRNIFGDDLEPSALKPKPLYYDEIPEFSPIVPDRKIATKQSLGATKRLIGNYLKDGLRKKYYLWVN